jgi:7-cyano-7-deazaguanine reductase
LLASPRAGAFRLAAEAAARNCRGAAFPAIAGPGRQRAERMPKSRRSGPEQLGARTSQPASPGEAKLETVANPHAGEDYLVRFICPEFTSLCPVTGQPDFAHLVIDYVPEKRILESKSLKLFLASFRNHGAFHEDCTLAVAKRLVAAMTPKWLRIGGYWYPRGGIPIDIFWQTGPPPKGLWLPEQGVPAYRGRG